MNKLEKANQYISENRVQKEELPVFHVAPPCGWMNDPNGRRIMIGWMQSWDSNIRPAGQKWSCMMTLPRELRIENGKILQSPVREIEKYHSNPVCYEEKEISFSCDGEAVTNIIKYDIDI